MFQQGKYWYTWVRDTKTRKRQKVYLGAELTVATKEFHKYRGGAQPPSRLTVLRFANKVWLPERIKDVRTADVAALAEARVKKYLEPSPIAHVRLVDLDSGHVGMYRTWLTQFEISPGTVYHILSDLRCLLGFAEQKREIDRSPFPDWVMPELQEKPVDRLSRQEAERVCAISGQRGRACRLMRFLGLRWGELIRAERKHVEGTWLVVADHTKNRRMRYVPIHPAVRDDVLACADRFVHYSVKSRGSFNRDIRRLMKDAGTPIDGFHAHRLRHTFCSEMAEVGMNPFHLQAIAGHRDIKTTMRYVSIQREETLRSAEAAWNRTSAAAALPTPQEVYAEARRVWSPEGRTGSLGA